MLSSIKNAATRAWRASFGKHLLVTNCVSCGGFFLLGDAIQQRIEMTQNPSQKFDMSRTLRLGLVGLTQVAQFHLRHTFNFFSNIFSPLGRGLPIIIGISTLTN